MVGGLVGVGSDDASINRRWVAAIAILAGLFSKMAIEKLAEILNEIFASAREDRAFSGSAKRLTELKRLNDEGLLTDDEEEASSSSSPPRRCRRSAAG